MLHMLQCLYMNVSSVCFKGFICFIRISQVFHIDVAKVDFDVHVFAMAIHVCYKCMFKYFIFFIRMLLVFYLDVVKLDLDVAYVSGR
jgi:hypothetical protein